MRWTLEHGMIVRRVGAGPELLWLHGLGEWSANFDAVAAHPALAGFSHVLPDLPGYGRSPWPDDGEDAPDDGLRDGRDARGAGDDREVGDGDGRGGRALGELADHLVAWLGDRRPALIGASMRSEERRG